MRFGSRGPSELFVSDTSPKCIDQEGLGRRRTGTRKEKFDVKIVNYDRQIIFVFGLDEQVKILGKYTVSIIAELFVVASRRFRSVVGR